MTRTDLLAADALARRRATQEFERHFILEAGAGTGKTTVLVSRFLVWCLGTGFDECARLEETGLGAQVLESVAALTFTEAAAAEMETRIARGLRDVAEGRTPLGLEVEQLSKLPDVALRARELLNHCERLQVSTIHAFCRRVLSAYPIEAGIAPRFRIDASGRASAVAARAAMEALLANPSEEDIEDLEALAERACGPAELETLLAALLAGPMQVDEFAEDPLASHRIEAWRARSEEALRDLPTAEPGAAELSGATSEALDAWVAALRERWPEKRRKALERDPQSADTAGLLRHVLSLEAGVLARIHRLLAPRFVKARTQLDTEGVLSFDDLLRRTRDLLQRTPHVLQELCRSLRQLFVDEFQDTDQVQCEIVSTLAFAESGPTLFVVGDPKQSIYAWRSADLRSYDGFLERLQQAGATHHQLLVSHRSLPTILDEVDTVFTPAMEREEGVQPAFAPLVASDALRAREGAADGERVAYWIAQRVDGAGAPASTTSAESLALETGALVEDLWRSHRERGLPWREIAILLRSTGELDDYLDALRRAGIPYAVDRDRIYFRRREVLEARALLRAILDPNDDLACVATLRSSRFGVPDPAWLPLMRSGGLDWMRRTLSGEAGARESLHVCMATVAQEIRDAPVPGLDALSEAGWQNLVLDGVDTLVALRECFEQECFELFLARARRAALIDISEGARFLGAYRLANLDRFFREIAELYTRSGADLAVVLRELRRDDVPLPESEEGRPPTTGADAVQVMTIHGAKGLDFEQVYLLQAHKGRAQRGEDALAADLLEGHWEYRLRWGRRLDEVAPTLAWDRVAQRREATERAEQVRTLYVAMTRAKTRLVVSGRLASARPGAAGSARNHADLLAKRLTATLPAGVTRRILATGDGAATRAPAPPRERDASLSTVFVPERASTLAYAGRPYGLAASAAAAQHFEGQDETWDPKPPSPSSAGAGQHAAAVGTAIHAYLEEFDFREEGDVTPAMAALRARIANWVPPEDRDEALRDALVVLERFRASPLWAHLRGLQPHLLGREVSILANPSAELRERDPVAFSVGAIDLLHRDPETGSVVVVDFKSDAVSDVAALRSRAAHYAPQGRVYCEAVASAMNLDVAPRFELWFLSQGERVVVDLPPPQREARSAQIPGAPSTALP